MINQITGYINAYRSRYGFIITDVVLVILRLTFIPWLVSKREHLFRVLLVYRVYHSSEYVTIPWRNHGAGRLTVKLGLFFLLSPARFPGKNR